MPDYATNIALIRNGVVENVIWGMFYSVDEYASEGFLAIPIDSLAVQTGYTFSDGRFYNFDGDVVMTVYEEHDAELAEMDEFIINELYNDIIDDIEEE